LSEPLDLRAPVIAEYQRRRSDKKEFGDNRVAALARDGYRCVSCGMTNDEHQERWGCTLTIDHIDGQGRGNPTPNGDLANLQTLCLRCHGSKDGKRADYSKRNTPRGERHYRAKLTAAQAAALRQDRTAGATFKELAARYGISISRAHGICSGKGWADTGP
jgi:5-methylcytosine-specific restriction endonuclease McrA